MTKEELTQQIVKQLINYDPLTGKLTWLKRDVKWFKDSEKRTADWVCKLWNSSNADKEAFTSNEGKTKYKIGSILGVHCKAHRLIWLWYYGEWPNIIDHIDGNPGNNRIENLRNVTVMTNCQNRRLRSDNTSGNCGVFWWSGYGKKNPCWKAYISENGKPKHLGNFKTEEEAIHARRTAEINLNYGPVHGK